MHKKLIKLTAAVTAAALTIATATFSAPFQATTVFAKEQQNTQYIVSQDGRGNFTTIQSAVDAANSGDTIIVCPGTYYEIVTVNDKELNIKGTNAAQCIIRSDSASYRQAPLSIGAGSVSDITIYGMYTGSDSARILTQEQIDQIGESTWEKQKNYKGYAVHIDQNYSYGKNLTFTNCRIISENSHCVGIGMKGENNVTFDNCEFIAMGDGGCLYMHDSAYSEYTGTSNLTIRNTRFINYLSPYVMTFETFLPDKNTTYLTFQNVKVSTVAYAQDDSYVINNVNTFFDVETQALLEKSKSLEYAGLKTSADILVNVLSHKEAVGYMNKIETAKTTGNSTELISNIPSEGITYISAADDSDTEAKMQSLYMTGTGLKKHQVIAVYNSDNLPSDGWCGLAGIYLTSQSFGNTLLEMNY